MLEPSYPAHPHLWARRCRLARLRRLRQRSRSPDVSLLTGVHRQEAWTAPRDRDHTVEEDEPSCRGRRPSPARTTEGERYGPDARD